ncbi:hypothetical protein [Streptomyces sp. CA2R101]
MTADHEGNPEVPSRYASMKRCVGGEFGDDMGSSAQRDPPGTELLDSK